QGERHALGVLEVLADRVAERLVCRGVPELLDSQGRRRGGNSVYGLEHGFDALLCGVELALHREEHERGAPVATDLAVVPRCERRAQIRDTVSRCYRRHDVAGSLAANV